jgi:hypothetical protein
MYSNPGEVKRFVGHDIADADADEALAAAAFYVGGDVAGRGLVVPPDPDARCYRMMVRLETLWAADHMGHPTAGRLYRTALDTAVALASVLGFEVLPEPALAETAQEAQEAEIDAP